MDILHLCWAGTQLIQNGVLRQVIQWGVVSEKAGVNHEDAISQTYVSMTKFIWQILLGTYLCILGKCSLLQDSLCSYPVSEEAKKLRSGAQVLISVKLTTATFTTKLADKTSLEYKNMKAKVIKAVRTHSLWGTSSVFQTITC